MSKKRDTTQQEENQNPMDSSLTRRVGDEGFWRELWYQARLVWKLIRSPEVPLYLKILPALALIYIFIPTDFIPDVFPGIGQLDDLTALIVGAKVFIELAPQEVVARQIQILREQRRATQARNSDREDKSENLEEAIIIEGDFQVIDEE